MVPIPPLDGSKLLFALFPEKVYKLRHFFERWGIFLVLIFIFFLWQFVSPLVTILFRIFTGVAI
jgi:Zn-dependent protease